MRVVAELLVVFPSLIMSTPELSWRVFHDLRVLMSPWSAHMISAGTTISVRPVWIPIVVLNCLLWSNALL
ncbi:hypothetical protein B0J14DRAFT_578184 [Halenospora varia]|nr:hypothetical protein B0J14DRAFT_578184 [Halenospora varia]